MLFCAKVLQQVQQLLGIGTAQLLFGHDITTGIMRAIDTILIKIVETEALVFLGIVALFQDQVYILGVGLLVGLGVTQHVLQESKCLVHILAQS